MAKAVSVASWNVRMFQDEDPPRAERVAAVLAGVHPDVVAVYEVVGKYVWRDLMDKMAGYSWFITEGPASQQILLGAKRGLTAFVTQKLEFADGVPSMRPGALCTVRVDGQDYELLFLHVASGQDPRGFGIREDMLTRALDFKERLDTAAPDGHANYVFGGDLNEMGMQFAFGRPPATPAEPPASTDEVTAGHEIAGLAWQAAQHGMRLLSKNQPATWRDGSGHTSDLDHVVAAEHLRFRHFGNGAEVDVRGWPQVPSSKAKNEWRHDYSDHALLYFEVQRV